jgi:hypothetical protein
LHIGRTASITTSGLRSRGEKNVTQRFGITYAVNQSDLDELLPQTRFQIFVGVELATQPMIAFDRCASALECSLHELQIERIKVTP